MKYRWFFSWVGQNKSYEQEFSNLIVTNEFLDCSEEMIRCVEDYIKSEINLLSCVVLNFQLLGEVNDDS